MKTILLSLTLLITFPAFSQHYRTVATDSEVYFDFKEQPQYFDNPDLSAQSYSICRVILTDSFQIQNNDTVIYHRTNQEFEVRYETIFDSLNQTNIDCEFYNTRDTGFLGFKTWLRGDGMDIYFNRFDDSIFIKTQATLNEEWVFFEEGDSIIYTATVVNIANENFLGITDSVKTVKLQVKDSLGNNIVSPYNALEIKISKFYGIIEGFNLFRFPYGTTFYNTIFSGSYSTISILGHSLNNLGVKNLTTADIYDFDIGDEYHWEYSAIQYSSGGLSGFEEYTYSLITIEDKYFSSTGDTVYYDIFLISVKTFYNQTNPVTTTYSYSTLYIGDETISYYIGDKSLVNTYSLHNDSISTWVQSADGSKKTTLDERWSTDGCLDLGEVRGANWGTYHKGIGLTWARSTANEPEQKRRVVYYSKSDTTWGQPVNINDLFVVSTKTASNENFTIDIFPNPTSDFINFQLEEPINNAQIRIYSTLGQLINTQNINDTNTQFNVSEWQNGMYFYGIFVAGEMVKSGQVLIVE